MNILLIVRYFPPNAGGGRSYRASKLVKQLTSLGHHVTVLCSDEKIDSDDSMLEDVNKDLLRIITAKYQTGFLSRIIAKIFRMTCVADGDYRFTYIIFNTLLKSQIGRIPNVVLSSSAPYEVHMVGRQVQKYFEIPWVADFRDPYTLNRNYSKKNSVAKYADRKFESYIYKIADGIIFNTNLNKEETINSFRLDKSDLKYVVCQNGYDAQDVGNISASSKLSDKFIISYIGGFRGDDYEIEIIEKLVRSADKLIELNVVFRFIGNGSSKLKKYADKIPLLFQLYGFCQLSELNRHWEESDAFLMLLPQNSDNKLGWVPQKLYSYMSHQKPILAYVPDGEAADYMRQYGLSVVSDDRKTGVIEELEALKAIAESGSVNSEFVEQLSQESLFANLSKWMESLVK